MRLRLRPNNHPPIAIDLGYASAKLLQVSGDRIVSADEIPMPIDGAQDVDARLDALHDGLLLALEDGAFRGRRVVLSMPGFSTVLQAMQLEGSEGTDQQLAMQMLLPDNGDEYMVRPIEVSSSAGTGRDVICQAMSRHVVLRHVEVLHGMKLDVVGVVAEPRPMVAAFEHLHRREDDGNSCTMHIDMGAGGTTVVMAHGAEIVLARSIAVGGRHFDQRIADALNCDLEAARAHRLDSGSSEPSSPQPPPQSASGMPLIDAMDHEGGSMQTMERRTRDQAESLGPNLNAAPAVTSHVDLSEVIETLVDDLRLCLRHHADAWPQAQVARVIFTGGEARQEWLCRNIVQRLNLAGQIGDPLARLACDPASTPLVDWIDRPKPDWSLVSGLAVLHEQGHRHAA
jgi:Tfp pilus assembly PilM family ATPase